MTWMSDKMRKWERSIDACAGIGAGRRVTLGWEGLTNDLEAVAAWSVAAMERLAVEVPDAAARHGIMLDRSCVFVEEFGGGDIAALRTLYLETGSPAEVVRAMRENPDRFGDPFIEDDAIVEIRRPRDPAALATAVTPQERRAAACFCPLVRESCGPLPLEHCCCSSGWYRGIYEGIFGVPVDVTVEESLLNGDDRCRFAVRVPGILQT